ncbi:MAG: glycosyltransferase family 4 protein, partial [Anaerolineae bacterium]|nr:glycosyltransferase family 4 protein [Anaerolineae bacterium]
PDETGVAALRADLGIGADDVVALCVGRMVPKKGFDVLIRALATPSLRERPVVGVMVGEGDDKAAWQQLALDLGVAERLRWVGNVPKTAIGRYYNMADVLAMPSVSRPADGLNVCVLDAMSCGKPVIGTTVAGNPLAIVNETTGLLIPEQDADALAGALARLVDDATLRRRMGAASRARIENELGWPHLARRYIQHYETLAARR